MFNIPDQQYPSLPSSLAMFTGLGLAHGLLTNIILGRPIHHRPLRLLSRTATGTAVGYAVHYAGLWFREYRNRQREYAERMVAWEEGVLARRAREAELAKNGKKQ